MKWFFLELRADVKYFTHNNGAQENLIQLNGTIPVFYKQQRYNIPICIWLYDKHPAIAPMVFVQPTPTMIIRRGKHVDASGKVYLPYLAEWKAKKSDLVGLVGILCTSRKKIKISRDFYNFFTIIFYSFRYGATCRCETSWRSNTTTVRATTGSDKAIISNGVSHTSTFLSIKPPILSSSTSIPTAISIGPSKCSRATGFWLCPPCQ